MSVSSSSNSCVVTTLNALLTNPYVTQCSKDALYSFTTLPRITDDQVDRMCASTACQNLLQDVQALNITECILSSGIRLHADLLGYVSNQCNDNAGTNNDNSTSQSNTQINGTAAPTSAPTSAPTDSPTTPSTSTPPSTTESPTTPATATPTSTTENSTTPSTASPNQDTTSTVKSPTTSAPSPEDVTPTTTTDAPETSSPSAGQTSSGSRVAASCMGRALSVISLGAMAVVTFYM